MFCLHPSVPLSCELGAHFFSRAAPHGARVWLVRCKSARVRGPLCAGMWEKRNSCPPALHKTKADAERSFTSASSPKSGPDREGSALCAVKVGVVWGLRGSGARASSRRRYPRMKSRRLGAFVPAQAVMRRRGEKCTGRCAERSNNEFSWSQKPLEEGKPN